MVATASVGVQQGVRPTANDTQPLDRLVSGGIPPAPRLTQQARVTFDADFS